MNKKYQWPPNNSKKYSEHGKLNYLFDGELEKLSYDKGIAKMSNLLNNLEPTNGTYPFIKKMIKEFREEYVKNSIKQEITEETNIQDFLNPIEYRELSQQYPLEAKVHNWSIKDLYREMTKNIEVYESKILSAEDKIVKIKILHNRIINNHSTTDTQELFTYREWEWLEKNCFQYSGQSQVYYINSIKLSHKKFYKYIEDYKIKIKYSKKLINKISGICNA